MKSCSCSDNVKPIGHTDLRGYPHGCQIVVQRRGRKYYAFVGHMKDMGTSIVDVTSADKPEVVTQIVVPNGTHSHKVRVNGDLMFVNSESLVRWDETPPAGFEGGLRIFNIKDIARPVELAFFRTGGRGVHRFWIDNKTKLAYISTAAEGYLANILMIVDFSDPRKPREISKWWLRGQGKSGGEIPTWDTEKDRCYLHHPIVLGTRAYLGYCDAGFVILDVSDKNNPKYVSGENYCPPYAGYAHTALPIAREILGRKWLVVVDEALPTRDHSKSLMWMVDITEEKNPVSVATYSVNGKEEPDMILGPHQVYEDVTLKDDLAFVAWFSGGLRIISLEKPYKPTEVGHYVPPREKGMRSIMSNDVYVDDRGLVYIIDRLDRGLDIVEYA